MTTGRSPIVGYADRAATWAPTGVPAGERQATLKPAPRGSHDIFVPRSNIGDAEKFIVDLNMQWQERGLAAKALLYTPQAADLYVQLIQTSTARFENRLRAVADDYKKTKKYTAQHAADVLAARRALRRELGDVTPIGRYFSTAEDALPSSVRTERLSGHLDTLATQPSPSRARYIVKQGRKVTIADEPRIKVNLKLAKVLKKVNTFTEVVEIVAPAAAIVAARNEKEKEQAIAQLAGATVSTLVSKGVPALCVTFGIATGGLGLLAIGIGAMAVGTVLGDITQMQIREMQAD